MCFDFYLNAVHNLIGQLYQVYIIIIEEWCIFVLQVSRDFLPCHLVQYQIRVFVFHTTSTCEEHAGTMVDPGVSSERTRMLGRFLVVVRASPP